MKKPDSKSLLQVFRPGGQDAADPDFAQALAQAKQDPHLARSLEEQRAFDSLVSQSLKEIPIPSDLRGTLLAYSPTTVAPPWWRQPAWLALAAGLVGLLVLTPFLGRARSYQDYRQRMTQAAWEGKDAHLSLDNGNLNDIRLWLARHGACSDFEFPQGLHALPIRGCRILDWHGHKVAFLCLGGGIQHKHLFVTDLSDLPDLPSEHYPQFARCGGWETASWRSGGKTYLICGMKQLTFVKHFRVGGQWAWN